MRTRGLTISHKIFFSTAFILICCIALLSYNAYGKLRTNMMEKATQKTDQILRLTALNLSTYIDDLYQLSLSPYYHEEIIEAIKTKESNPLDQLYQRRIIENYLDQILITPRKDILRVFILTDRIYHGERYPSSIKDNIDLTNFPWYTEALESNTPIFVSTHEEALIKSPRNTVFSIVNQIRDTKNTNNILGLIKVDANYRGIKETCDPIDMGPDGGLLIIDQQQNVVYENRPAPFTLELQDLFKEKVLPTDHLNNTGPYHITTDHYLLTITSVKKAGWTIVGITSLSSLEEDLKPLQFNFILVSIISFATCLFIILIYLRTFLQPFKKIVSGINKIQDGDLDVVFHVHTKDELQDLANALNTMVARLKTMFGENERLVREIYETRYLHQQAQYHYLCQQIRPHFINNTLNMMSILIQQKQQEKALATIRGLSTLLSMMTHMEKDVPLSHELQLIEAYLAIQQIRYEGRLFYKIKILSTLHSVSLPAFILQPLVENAVVHGCERQIKATHIDLYSEISTYTPEVLTLIIEDNGPGFTTEAVKAFIKAEAVPQEHSHGIALLNVHRRLQLQYGEGYGLRLASRIKGGAKIILSIPLTQPEK